MRPQAGRWRRRRLGGQGRRACGRSGSRAGYISAPAAPQIRARHCRAMVGGAAGPATSAPPRPARATSALCRATMHGAAQAFGRVRAIGAAKNVSFKKTDRVRFKINYQKVLKLKKNSLTAREEEESAQHLFTRAPMDL